MVNMIRGLKWKASKFAVKHKTFARYLPIIGKALKRHEIKRIYLHTGKLLKPSEVSNKEMRKIVKKAINCTAVIPKLPRVYRISALISLTMGLLPSYFGHPYFGLAVNTAVLLILCKFGKVVDKIREDNLLFTSGYYLWFPDAIMKEEEKDGCFLRFKKRVVDEKYKFFLFDDLLPHHQILLKHKQVIVINKKRKHIFVHEFAHFFLKNITEAWKMGCADFLATTIEEWFKYSNFVSSNPRIFRFLRMVRTEKFFLKSAFNRLDEDDVAYKWGQDLINLIFKVSLKFKDKQKRLEFQKRCINEISRAFYLYRKYAIEPRPLVSLFKRAEASVKDLKNKDDNATCNYHI